jgi:hypothetical protein
MSVPVQSQFKQTRILEGKPQNVGPFILLPCAGTEDGQYKQEAEQTDRGTEVCAMFPAFPGGVNKPRGGSENSGWYFFHFA